MYHHFKSSSHQVIKSSLVPRHAFITAVRKGSLVSTGNRACDQPQMLLWLHLIRVNNIPHHISSKLDESMGSMGAGHARQPVRVC